ncbi:mechanosensitive ion channel family protein [Natronomonas sp. EA1]|uniref:mechanosensitive ion channel family protein n=1 Tax=Natronomonas sp. EA1 TaxID=3421655 RepID=UPI003EC0800D
MTQSDAPVDVPVDVPLDIPTLTGVVTTLLLAYLFARLATAGLTAVSERAGNRRITVKMVIPVAKFCIYAAAVYSILVPILQVSGTQLLALSGLIGAAIGFGVKDLAAGVIGGFLLIVERPYQVGDKVELGGTYGEVRDIGLRSTRLVTPDDSAVSVPNAAVFVEAVTNANDGNAEMQVVIDLPVAHGADHDRAATIVEEALLTSPYLYLTDDHPVVVLVDAKPTHRRIRGKAYVNDLRDEFAFDADVSRRALAAFDEAGIESPALSLAESGDA